MSSLSRRTLFRGAATAAWMPAGAASGEERIVPGLRVIRGAVNTAVFERNGKALLIDPGALEGAGKTPVEWALVTHHHRDQASAARRLAAAGAKIVVPAAERPFFADAEGFWRNAERILDHRYDFRPHLFTFRENIPVAAAVDDGAVHNWQGLRFEAMHTPGHTDGSLSYLVETGGKRIAFTGDLIYGPGRIWEMYSLQKRFPKMGGDYWGFAGAVAELKASLKRVLARKPDLLIPSHGEVIADPPAAVSGLNENLDALMRNYLTTAGWRVHFPKLMPPGDDPPMLPKLPPVGYPPWVRNVASTTKALVAGDRSLFIIDCGGVRVLQQLGQWRNSKEIAGVDAVWVSHHHDDHTDYLNDIRRHFGCPIYAQQELAGVLQNPTAYEIACLSPEPVRVDRILKDGESFTWKEFRLTSFYFPGQTLYHAGLLAERDGYRVFFTGDSFVNWGIDDYCANNRCFAGRDVGYDRCIRVLLETEPHMLVGAHTGPLPVTAEYLEKTRALLREREALYKSLFPWDDPNFAIDPRWVSAFPYRQAALSGAVVEIEARVMNHSTAAKDVMAELRLPAGWEPRRPRASQRVPAKTEGRLRLSAVAPATPERPRHVIGLSAVTGGRALDEIGEAIVDILG